MAQEARGGVVSARGKSGSACALLLRAACRSTSWQPGDVFQGSGLGPVALPVGRLYLAIPTARSLNPSNRRQALPRRREASTVLLRARWRLPLRWAAGGEMRRHACSAPPPQNTSKQNKTVHAQSQPGRNRSPPRRSARERRGRRAPGWRAHLPGGRRRRRRRRHRPGPRRGARHRRCFCFCPRGATCSARGPSQRRSSRRTRAPATCLSTPCYCILFFHNLKKKCHCLVSPAQSSRSGTFPRKSAKRQTPRLKGGVHGLGAKIQPGCSHQHPRVITACLRVFS